MPWTAGTCRPGRAGHRCGGWSTSCPRAELAVAKAVPSRLAWETGQQLADSLLARYREETGGWPSSVGLSVWGTAAMRTSGDDVAEVLALLGARPVTRTTSAGGSPASRWSTWPSWAGPASTWWCGSASSATPSRTW